MIKKKNALGRISVIFIFAGIILVAIGWFMGARGLLYVDSAGIHVQRFDDNAAYEPTLAQNTPPAANAGSLSEGTGTEIHETNIDPFTNVKIDVQYADIELIASGAYGIEASLPAAVGASWQVQDNTLTFSATAARDTAYLGTSNNYIKVYYPTGAQLDKIDFSTNAGNITLKGHSMRSLQINGNMGDIRLSDIQTDETLVKTNAGSVVLADTVSAKVEISTDYGDIEADNLTAQQTAIHASAGSIGLSGNLTGSIEIDVELGDIAFATTASESSFSYALETSLGDIRLNGANRSNGINGRVNKELDNSANSLQIDNSAGSISVTFAD
jgi:hypothetical protein